MDRTVGNLYNFAMIADTHAPPPDILVTGHFKELPGYAVYRSHGSGSWLITYTLKGQGLYQQPGIEMPALPGDLVLLQPDALHDYSVPLDGNWEFLWAHFQPRMTWLSWWQLPTIGHGLFKVHVHTLQVRERIQQAFLQLHADTHPHQDTQHETRSGTAVESASIIQRELALNGLEAILLLATRELTSGYHHPLDERVQRILDLIRQDFTTQHSLETLAQEVSLSPSRLGHLFKQNVGDSITNVLLSVRLGQAARLLEFTTDSIQHIAEQVGFSSAFYFSRQFHQRFGMSPREYRTMITAKARTSSRTDIPTTGVSPFSD
jgi:AraC family transcriptional regulator of arabinose operon